MDIGEESLKIMAKASWYNRWLYSFVKPYLGKKILELGSGIGNFTELLADGKRFVDVSDIENKYLKKLRTRFKGKKVKVTRIDLGADNTKARTDYYDTVICLNVLEHIRKDGTALNLIYRSLKHSGRLVLLVPAHKMLFGSLDKNLKHYRRYSKKELVEKLTKSGFKIEKIRHLNFFGTLGWFLNSKILRRKIVSGSQVVLFDRLARPALLAEKVIKLPFGLSLFAVAKK